jgi:hypothetical protein
VTLRDDVSAIDGEWPPRVTAAAHQAVAGASDVQPFARAHRYDDRSNLARTNARRGGEGLARRSVLGDLTPAEIRQIQGVVNEAGRPLEVVGSAARGGRRGIGTDLPIGKGPGTRSDIDYLVPHGSLPHYETTGLYKNLPDLDRIIPGAHNPYIGPAIRLEPWADPFFVPGAPL